MKKIYYVIKQRNSQQIGTYYTNRTPGTIFNQICEKEEILNPKLEYFSGGLWHLKYFEGTARITLTIVCYGKIDNETIL